MKYLKLSLIVPCIYLISGCDIDLNVENQNQPDKSRALTSPSDIENLIGGAYNSYFYATEGWTPAHGLSVIADEQTSSWGNAGMKDLSVEPRTEYNNSTGYIDKLHVEDPWYRNYSAISSINEALGTILDPDNPMELGDNGADTQRGIAFARFIQGICYGYLGCFFDQAYLVDETTDMEAIAGGADFSPSPYTEVAAAGIGYLEDCIAICETNTFTLPSTWIYGNAFTNDELAALAHSYAARYMAGVARTPADRDALDWNAILAHAELGYTDDFGPYCDGYVNWGNDYRYAVNLASWKRADYKTVGIADTSGNYEAWLNTPVHERTYFDIHTADARITGGHPDSAGTYFSNQGECAFQAARGTYHFSYYWFDRHIDFIATLDTKMITLYAPEMPLLRAEGLYRQGDLAGAAALVNLTRESNGQLPPLTGSEPDFFKWLKYEKKIETYHAPGLAYFDRRGWTADPETGQVTELPTGTPLHFPIPAKELEVALLENYTHGGSTGDFAPRTIPRSPMPYRKR